MTSSHSQIHSSFSSVPIASGNLRLHSLRLSFTYSTSHCGHSRRDDALPRRPRSYSTTVRYIDMSRLLARQVLNVISFFGSSTPSNLVSQLSTLPVTSLILSLLRLRFPVLLFRLQATIPLLLFLQAAFFFRPFVIFICMHRNSSIREQAYIYL